MGAATAAAGLCQRARSLAYWARLGVSAAAAATATTYATLRPTSMERRVPFRPSTAAAMAGTAAGDEQASLRVLDFESTVSRIVGVFSYY